MYFCRAVQSLLNEQTPSGLFHGEGVGGPTVAAYYPESALLTNMYIHVKIAIDLYSCPRVLAG